ncbi:MAG: helix-turn-helix domain-containing protein [Calditrichaeota bacterium]|nr:helix-turn-helix domain-containing protein [Calditrichota bacterium]
MQSVSPVLLKSPEAAAILGISTTTLHRYVKAGKIECVRFAGNSVYFTQQQLDEFVDRHRKRYSPNPPKSGKTA